MNLSANTIGLISLNISTLFYLSQYWPQLLHNREKAHLENMSLLFHGLLFFTYFTDLIYAMGMNMPWQYQLVSSIGSLCLLIQHRQLANLYKNNKLFVRLNLILFMMALLLIIIGFWAYYINKLNPFYITLETLSQIGALIYILPQFFKNYQRQNTEALSPLYLFAMLITSLCDATAAWTLNFPWPNQFGALIRIGLVMCLIVQTYVYQKSSLNQITDKRLARLG